MCVAFFFYTVEASTPTFMLENSVHTDANSWEVLHYPLWEPSVHGLRHLIIPA